MACYSQDSSSCNDIPILSYTLNCYTHIDDELYSDSKTLASVKSKSGVNIQIQHLRISDGNWDVLVKSVDKDTISSMRLHGLEILDPMTPNIKQEEGRQLEKKANSIEYWSFFMARNSAGFSQYIVYLVIPNWNLVEFQSHRLRQTIFSILCFCNSQNMPSIAFPILGYKSKNIPLAISARLLLQAFGDYSLCVQTPSLKDIRIVISNESCVDTFLSLFLNPIRQHLTESSNAEQCVRDEEEEENCSICLSTLHSGNEVVRRLPRCKHEFHEECISRAIKFRPVCPLCTISLDVQRGDQPQGGVMTHCILSHSLPGYREFKTIEIHYDIPAGIQTQMHPHPGLPYPSTTRIAYLPNSSRGQMVLNLLQLAFERGLIFTVGRSLTSGLDNVISWNDIHHKTVMSGSVFGYPDVDYLNRVLSELKDKGVE